MTIGQNTPVSRVLMSFVERLEAVKRRQKECADDRRVIMAEAKAAGFIPKAIDVVLKARAMKPSDFREGEELRELYLHAAGLANEPPLFRQIEAMAGDLFGRDEIIERFKLLVPTSGAITVELKDGKPVKLTRDKDGNVTAQEIEPQPVATESRAGGYKAPPPAPVPDVNEDVAEMMGREAYREDKPITDNPFPFGDKRRPRWDRGWRLESGSDGMGPEDDE